MDGRVGGWRDRWRRHLSLAAASRFLKSDTDWNLQFCREEAITSQVNIQPPERQRRVLHKAADVWAHAGFNRGVCSPLLGISPIWSHLNTHCPPRLCTYSFATNCIITPTDDLISAILGTFFCLSFCSVVALSPWFMREIPPEKFHDTLIIVHFKSQQQ